MPLCSEYKSKNFQTYYLRLMKGFISLVFLCFAMTCVQAQNDSLYLSGMNMRHLGPGTMSGRVTTIDLVQDKPEIIYIGTASGGAWKSESGGITWSPIFDQEATSSVGAIAINQKKSDQIWLGTGEGNPRNSHSSGKGIYRSLNGGRTWELMGLEATKNIHRIIIDPNNDKNIYVAALGSIWGKNPERGVYKSEDGGTSWKHVLKHNDETACADLVMDPENSDKLFAAMWEYGRKPWTFNSGGEGSSLSMTLDGGKTWERLNGKNGLPDGPYGRIGIAIAQSDSKVVYALIESEKTGLYRSSDGGFTWKLQATEDIGNRPFYYADIFVHPKEKNTVYNLYSMVSKSIDGGKNFEVILPYSGAHPDHHAFYIHPENPDLMLDGNDGGLNISRDGGEHWQFVNNLPVGQFYHINYDLETPYHIYGGMQDNGSWKAPAYAWISGPLGNNLWQEISFGDGFDVVPIPGDSRYVYSMYQGGNVYNVDTESGEMIFIQPTSADSIPLRFNWNAAIAIDPHSADALYFGSQFVHYSEDRGLSWTQLSPDLTTNDPEKQQQALSGGLTIDATRAENHTTITCIAPHPAAKEVIWVGTDDGNLQLTKDAGKTWTKMNLKSKASAGIKDMPAGAWVAQITPGVEADEVFVVVNDYRRNNWEPYVFYSNDFGKTWSNLVESTMDKEGNELGHCHAVVQHPNTPDLLFLGAENGLFYSFDRGVSWTKWTYDYPTVPTIDLKIHPVENDLIIGTFGRGAYILDDIAPLEFMARSGFEADSFEFVSAPDAYLANYKQPAGSRFEADHQWNGENRRGGARLTFFIGENTLLEDEKEGLLKVYSSEGEEIRAFKVSLDSGLVTVPWDLREQGVFWPSRSERKEDALPGGGMSVAPGEYQVELSYQDLKASGSVKVHYDPRVVFIDMAYAERYDLHQQLEKTVVLADSLFESMKEMRKTIKLAEQNLNYLSDSTLTDLSNQLDSLNQECAAFEGLYMIDKDFKGYDHVTERLTNVLWNASNLIDTGREFPGENAARAVQIAQERTAEVAKKHEEMMSFYQELKARLEENAILPKK